MAPRVVPNVLLFVACIGATSQYFSDSCVDDDREDLHLLQIGLAMKIDTVRSAGITQLGEADQKTATDTEELIGGEAAVKIGKKSEAPKMHANKKEGPALKQVQLNIDSNSSVMAKRHSDVRLQLPDVLAGFCEGGEFVSHGVTNPSFVQQPSSNKAFAAFRGLCLGGHTAFSFTRWSSFLILGTTDMEKLSSDKSAVFWNISLVDDPRPTNHDALKECMDPGYAKLAWAEGPEDPKLFNFNGKTYLMFIAAPLQPSVEISSSAPKCIAVTGRPVCENDILVPHLAEIVSSGSTFGPVVPLKLPGMGAIEKNWAPFSWHPSNQPEQLLMVYNMYPHTILQANVSTGHMQRAYETNSTLLANLAQTLGDDHFHCNGAGVVPVQCSDGSACNLAIFHWKDKKYRYSHWPYKFSAEPPFEIRELGNRLPLRGQPNPVTPGSHVEFITSLTAHAGQILIGYNTGDQAVNMFRMPLSAFDLEYFS
jgi:hypothetical protein